MKKAIKSWQSYKHLFILWLEVSSSFLYLLYDHKPKDIKHGFSLWKPILFEKKKHTDVNLHQERISFDTGEYQRLAPRLFPIDT